LISPTANRSCAGSSFILSLFDFWVLWRLLKYLLLPLLHSLLLIFFLKFNHRITIKKNKQQQHYKIFSAPQSDKSKDTCVGNFLGVNLMWNTNQQQQHVSDLKLRFFFSEKRRRTRRKKTREIKNPIPNEKYFTTRQNISIHPHSLLSEKSEWDGRINFCSRVFEFWILFWF
jgi:hypothetical protein